MTPELDPHISIQTVLYGGDIVFAVSGALTAARYKMDVLGYVLIGTITGIGGGTIRDLLLGRTVWWTQNPVELLICATAALLTFFLITPDISRRKWMTWSDAIGLAAFCVVGCNIALENGAPVSVAVFMGMVTATGGGVIRDIITNSQPMITSGQVYATAALLGSLWHAMLKTYGPLPETLNVVVSCGAAFALRAGAVIFNVRMGPPGQFIRFGKSDEASHDLADRSGQ